MTKHYDVKIKVESITGTCEAGYKVGDEWLISGVKLPGGLCVKALAALLPTIRTLQLGGNVTWATDKKVARTLCTDPDNTVIFELTRMD